MSSAPHGSRAPQINAADSLAPTRKEIELVSTISLEGLIRGFPVYFSTLRRILCHPFRFAAQINVQDRAEFQRAIDYAIHGIFVTFVIVIPIFLYHSTDVAKVAFFARLVVQLTAYGLILHLTLKFLGARTVPWRGTLGAYSYLGATGMPLYILLAYPLLLSLGPAAIFGSASDVVRMGPQLLATPWLYHFGVALNGVGLLGMAVVVPWFAKTHQIGRLRVLLAILASGLIGALVQLVVVAPFFNVVFVWVEKIL